MNIAESSLRLIETSTIRWQHGWKLRAGVNEGPSGPSPTGSFLEEREKWMSRCWKKKGMPRAGYHFIKLASKTCSFSWLANLLSRINLFLNARNMTTRLHQISAFSFGLDLDCWFPKSLYILTSNTRILKTWSHTSKNSRVFDDYFFWSLSPKSQIHSFSKSTPCFFRVPPLAQSCSGQDFRGGPHGNGFFWLEDHSGFTLGFLQIVA